MAQIRLRILDAPENDTNRRTRRRPISIRIPKNALEIRKLVYYCVDNIFTGDLPMGKDAQHVVQDCIFTWDAAKADSNRRKHGISFEEACEVFFDPLYDMREDAGSEEEQRWIIVGYSKSNRPLSVVAVEHDEAWRIVSARKLEPEEKRHHEEEDDPQ
jgi:uncharacterized protein